MALVSCPECGKQKVSDTAECCPECGFAIKKHYEKIKEDEELKRRNLEIENHKCQRFQEISKELKQKLKHIDEESYPEKPNFFKMLFDSSQGGQLTYGLIAIMIVSFFIGFFANVTIFAFIFAFALMVGFPFLLFINYSDYKMELDSYYKKTKDWNDFKKKRKKRLIEYYKNKDEINEWYKNDSLNAEMKKARSTLRCPIYYCTKVKRITTVNSTVSVAMVGLASSKIGKQYKCEVCHHRL